MLNYGKDKDEKEKFYKKRASTLNQVTNESLHDYLFLDLGKSACKNKKAQIY